MASNYTGLGIQLMTTGEKAGTWGTLTNTNWNIMEQISGGYVEQAITSTPTTLAVNDGTAGATLAHRIIKFTGTIGENTVVTIPIDVQTFYIITNGSSGSYTVQFKYVSGSGSSVTWAATDKGTKIIYAAADDGTNPNIVDIGMGDVTLTGTQTLTNKTLTAPKFADGGYIADANGNESLVFGTTGSAVNEVKITNAATGTAGPIIASQGESNSNLQLRPSGTGVITVGTSAANATITSKGAHDLILSTNEGSSSGTITITDASNGDITLTPDGTGVVKATDGADATAAVKIAGKESMWIPAMAMYPTSTNGCADLAQTELTAQQPEIKTLDFDKDSDEFAQFAVAFPKSWNLGTVTYQAFFCANSTNTGTVAWFLEGYAASDDDAIDTAFGTAVGPTAKAGSGTANDLLVTAESGAVTIAGSPADNDECFFQIYRDVSADSLTADAKLLGIKFFFTTDAANDA